MVGALPTAALGIVLAIVVSILVWLGIVLMQHQPATQTAAAVTLSVNPAVRHYYVNGPGVSTLCGLPVAPAAFARGIVTQKYRGCVITGRYSVRSNASPTPLPAPTAARTARPSATAVPLPTWTAVPAPTATAVPSNDPVLYLLGLLNGERHSHGIAPLALNITQSACSLTHSLHMAAEGFISHDQWPSDLCVPWGAAGENVGMAVAPEQTAILLDFNQMMSEYTGSCSGVTSHACNILGPSYHQIGIGIDYVSGTLWLTEDFTN